jgi:hypothetical protein
LDKSIKDEQYLTSKEAISLSMNYLQFRENSDNEYNFVCDFDNCNKKFSTKGNLTTHLFMHTGNKKFKCNFDGCNKSYTNQSRMVTHFRTHVIINLIINRLGRGHLYARSAEKNLMKKAI